MAGIVIINKVNTAKKEDIEKVRKNIQEYNPKATVLEVDSVITVENPEGLKGKKVLVIEDGPTTTHGGMGYGAGYLAAKQFGAEIVDPRKYAVGSIKEAFQKFTQLKEVLPALGYGEKQLKELEQTINKVPCDLVLVGTPINLAKLIRVNKPCVRVYYNMGEKAVKGLTKLLEDKI